MLLQCQNTKKITMLLYLCNIILVSLFIIGSKYIEDLNIAYDLANLTKSFLVSNLEPNLALSLTFPNVDKKNYPTIKTKFFYYIYQISIMKILFS